MDSSQSPLLTEDLKQPEEPEQLEQPDQLEPTVQPEQPEQPEQLEAIEQPEQPEQPEQLEAIEQPEQPEQPEQLEATEQPVKVEQPEQPDEPVPAEQVEESPPLGPQRGDILEGTILSIGESGVLVDLGVEREALVPARDLTKLSATRKDALQVEKAVSVYVTDAAGQGQIKASIHRAVLNEKWIEAEKLKESGEIWEAPVTGYNQGGVIVPFGKLRAFVPISHLLDIPRRSNPSQIRERLGNYIGRTLPLRVIEVDRRRRRLVCSYRKAYPEWRERQRQQFVDSLTEGEVRTGRVRNLRDFGAFVDLGGGDGLVHISELAWHRVDHPKEVLRVGQEVQVYVLKVNRKRKRVALSIKRLTPHPWSTVDDRYHENQLVEGKITRITSFGAFVELEPGVEGLLHVRHLPRAAEQDPNKVVSPGEIHLLRILGVDSERRRIRLSMRAVTPEEQMDFMARRAEEALESTDDTIGLAELIGEEE
jgi:small subunit ribosomal protein S1